MRSFHWFVLVVGIGLASGAARPATAQQNQMAAAEELKRRVTALALLPGGTVASGSTFGVVLWDSRPAQKGAPASNSVPARQEWETHPRPGGVLLPDSVSGMVLQGKTLAVAHGPAGLTLLDVSDTTLIKPLSHLGLPGAALDVVADSEGLLWVSMGTMGVACVDVSSLSAPRLVGVVEVGGYVRHVAVEVLPSSKPSGGPAGKAAEGGGAAPVRLLWVAAGQEGLVRVKLGPGTAVLDSTVVAHGADVRKVLPFRSGLLYSWGHTSVCFLVLRQPTCRTDCDAILPVCVDGSDVIRDILVLGNKVLAADGGAGVMVADFSDLLTPKCLGHMVGPKFTANRLMIVDDLLFVAADAAGVLAFPIVDLP